MDDRDVACIECDRKGIWYCPRCGLPLCRRCYGGKAKPAYRPVREPCQVCGGRTNGELDRAIRQAPRCPHPRKSISAIAWLFEHRVRQRLPLYLDGDRPDPATYPEMVDASDLTDRQQAVLACVRERHGVTVRQIRATLGLRSQQVSRALRTLRALHLVYQTQHRRRGGGWWWAWGWDRPVTDQQLVREMLYGTPDPWEQYDPAKARLTGGVK